MFSRAKNSFTKQAETILDDHPDMLKLDKQSRQDVFSTRSEPWSWRMQMVEAIAAHMKPERFGVAGFYVFGSTKNANAGLQSDIDLLIHFQGTDSQHKELLTWLEGWSLCLSEINYRLTGLETDGLLDIHIVTDDDIKKRTSYAVKIGAITDPARSLPMGTTLTRK
jgi:predicted nucleotidyltransferase